MATTWKEKQTCLREGIEWHMKIDRPKKKRNIGKFPEAKEKNSHKQVQETWSDYGSLKGWYDVS